MSDFARDSRGLEMVEYIIVGGLAVLILILAFVQLMNTLRTKLGDINSGL